MLGLELLHGSADDGTLQAGGTAGAALGVHLNLQATKTINHTIDAMVRATAAPNKKRQNNNNKGAAVGNKHERWPSCSGGATPGSR